MKMLIWKEVRENLLWALLLMLALGGAERYALHYIQYGSGLDLDFNDGITLCKKTFLTVTLFGSATVGLLLGFLQVLPELKRDQWAALMHRPMPAGKIFLGKALAGLLLYFIAAGVPLLYSVWHVATPGNLNVPFVPSMIKPGLADWFSGIAYYFAALCVALQGGRLLWRALPFFAAIHVSFASLDTELFRVALEGSLAMAVVLAVAGWGAIQARDSLRRRPWVGQAAFFVVAFYGVCGAGDILEMEGGLLGYKGMSKYSAWEVFDNGVPVRFDYRNSVLMSATDLDGKPFADPKYHADRARSHTVGMNSASSYIGDPHGWKRWRYTDRYRDSWTYIYAEHAYNYPRLEQWFFVKQSRHFVGVSPPDRRVFAQFGANGFVSREARVQAIPESATDSTSHGDTLFIADGNSLQRVLFSRRQVESISLPEPGPIYGMAHAWAQVPNGSVDFKGVALSHSVAVYDTKGTLVATLPYRQDVDRWGQIALGVLPSMDRFVLHYNPSAWIPEKTRRTMPSYVDVVDARGVVLNSYTCAPLPLTFYPERWSEYFGDRLRSSFFFFGRMLYQRVAATLGSERLYRGWISYWGGQTRRTWEMAGVLGAVGLVAAVIVFFWARRAQMPQRSVRAWTLAALVLGPAGFLMFWLIGERPATVACPACRRPRRIDAELCAHCGAAWPAREEDFTEILETLTVST